jgi:two-component system, chemotaxis family, response regulator Rcp1
MSIAVLLVEDNPGDVGLIREALREAKRDLRLHVARDGAEAVEFMHRQGRHTDAPRPHLVLLDLNLPNMGGREVLARIKGDAHLRSIPVIVMTSSDAPRDVDACYDLHANCYVVKPFEVSEFARVLGHIEELWLSSARLPRGLL